MGFEFFLEFYFSSMAMTQNELKLFFFKCGSWNDMLLNLVRNLFPSISFPSTHAKKKLKLVQSNVVSFLAA